MSDELVYSPREDFGTCSCCGAEDVDRRLKVCFACAMLEDPESDPSELRRALQIYRERGQDILADQAQERLAKLN